MSMNSSLGSSWMKSHPDLLQGVPEYLNASELIHIPLNTYNEDVGIVQDWKSANWSGVCDKLTSVSSPTLIITGTEDHAIPTANSLVIAAKIPGAWLVQIKDAGHGLPEQYPDKVANIVKTFLSTVK